MARKNLNMIKMLKAITFLSLAMCLMPNSNVAHAGNSQSSTDGTFHGGGGSCGGGGASGSF